MKKRLTRKEWLAISEALGQAAAPLDNTKEANKKYLTSVKLMNKWDSMNIRRGECLAIQRRKNK